MSQVIKIDEQLYQRLSTHVKGFETPSQVINKILDFYEKENNIESNSVENMIDRYEKENNITSDSPIQLLVSATRLDIIYHPINDENAFKRALLKTKLAYVKMYKTNGESEIAEWHATRFTESSSVKGNLTSGYLRDWRNRGIFKAEISIDKASLT
ncbi:MAG: hypothetical protein FE834_05815 [Gammaproteobacteria bacterium]|nr:hypothetical protein [Gammaproteobacteria bacterium]